MRSTECPSSLARRLISLNDWENHESFSAEACVTVRRQAAAQQSCSAPEHNMSRLRGEPRKTRGHLSLKDTSPQSRADQVTTAGRTFIFGNINHVNIEQGSVSKISSWWEAIYTLCQLWSNNISGTDSRAQNSPIGCQDVNRK